MKGKSIWFWFRRKRFCGRLIFSLIGLASLVWFLVRVIPKPSRASYPCQRAAFPIASSFVIWLVGIICSISAMRKARTLITRSRYLIAVAFFAVSIGCIWFSLTASGEKIVLANNSLPNAPLGTARGIHPGRVVWVHDPNATNWDGFESEEHWWQDGHTDPNVVEQMISQAVRSIAGKGTEEDAWDAIFRYFNNSCGKGDVGYQSGEKVAIKINLTTCAARNHTVDPVTYNKKSSIMNKIDNSPQMILSLLRQLIDRAGVDPNEITVGDPTGMVPNYYWNMLQPKFPDVKYLGNFGGSGRTRSEFSNVPIYWSTDDADEKLQDYLPVSFADADYIINFAILKGHGAGVTLCAKNHYGSLLRCPDGYLRDSGYLDYYDMHQCLSNEPGSYRALVDLMGHEELGGKTLLYLIDGLFGGYKWDAHPYKWLMPPFGDGVTGDWPNSLFASLDPVAIDSVAYDFLLQEWPHIVAASSLEGGAEDYLHEAAMADFPDSRTFYDPDNDGNSLQSLGVHEHWNNYIDKQYSRNLGTGNGIELIKISSPFKTDFNLDNKVNLSDFALFAVSWKSSPGDSAYNPLFDVADPNDIIDEYDLAVLAEDWLK
ncbi:MAG: DUF362 domain-containing protein [Planctomycetes bacterium]|nr:DUF362 domain-containing protein [Planctomycetota bacterium]